MFTSGIHPRETYKIHYKLFQAALELANDAGKFFSRGVKLRRDNKISALISNYASLYSSFIFLFFFFSFPSQTI